MSYPVCFLLVNMQNDLCHPDGTYAKQGLTPSHIPEIVPPIVASINFCRQKNIPVISMEFTILTDLEDRAAGLREMLKHRPFLENEGFRKKSWGYDLLEEIPQVDYKISQWSLSPFYQTELDRHLSVFDTKTIILSGFTTNGSVESCAREAVGRSIKVITLTDCVASYSESLHKASLTNLDSFGQIINSKDWMESYEADRAT